MFGPFQRTSVGLDLGTTGIRAAEITGTGSGIDVVRLASVPLPPGAIEHGTIRDQREVVRALKRLWRQGRFVTRKVTFGVDPAAVLTRQMDLPWMAPEDFKSALRYQVQDVLPVDVRTVEVDYHLLEELHPSAGSSAAHDINRVLVVASSTEGITDTAQVLRKAGLRPVAADSDAFALIRAVCRGTAGQPSAAGDAEAVVDIGASQITVIIHRDAQPLLVRSVGTIGGATATNALAQSLDLSVADAERLKIRVGLNGPAPIVAPIAESSVFAQSAPALKAQADPQAERAVGVLGQWATSVVKEIKDSIDYFESAVPGSPVSRLVLTGRTCLIDGLQERIATQVRVPVTVLEPLAGLRVRGSAARHEAKDSRYVVALGLAIS